MMDMLALFQGNYQAIQGLVIKIKTVLIANLPGGVDTQ